MYVRLFFLKKKMKGKEGERETDFNPFCQLYLFLCLFVCLFVCLLVCFFNVRMPSSSGSTDLFPYCLLSALWLFEPVLQISPLRSLSSRAAKSRAPRQGRNSTPFSITLQICCVTALQNSTTCFEIE